MIYFKSCPRCSGDRTVADDHYGKYLSCLHCGHVSYPTTAEAKPEPRRRRTFVAGPEHGLAATQALISSLRLPEHSPAPIPNP